MVDWDNIRVEYEATTVSIRKLAARFGITDGAIRQKAKKDNWSRGGGIEKHVEKKVRAVVAVQKLDAEEQKMPIVTRMAVQQKVMDRVAAINLISTMQSGVLERLQGLLDHDAQVQMELGKEVSPNEYGKTKITNDILKDAKKTMLGDIPIVDMNEDLGKAGEADDWVVVIPAQEKKRLEEVDREDD